MKRLLSIFTVVAVMAASCKSNTKTDADNAGTNNTKPEVYTDTTGLAQFQAWKAQHELADPKEYNQSTATTQPATKTVVKYVPISTSKSRSTASRSRSTNSGSGTMNSESGHTAMRKKGWSKAAKGAAIGGVAGGVAGAVINKRNRVAGGVIGGVVGAGVGYGIGRHKDKKDGRY